MIWVWVFLGVGLIALISTVSYGVWLFHKAQDLYSEIQMLGKRGDELQALIAQIKFPEPKSAVGSEVAVSRTDHNSGATLV